MKNSPQIILASTSPFRKTLLEKLCLPFNSAKPEIDETAFKNESVEEMVQRLSLAKARKIAAQNNNAIIIASDQSAAFNNTPIGKPHNRENAIHQLTSFSGQTVIFYTGLAVIDTLHNQVYESMDTTKVTFRKLDSIDIENYLDQEEPYQCAGSFKSEGLGISLFEKLESSDPNALIGLPLIKLTSIFKSIGIQVPPKI